MIIFLWYYMIGLSMITYGLFRTPQSDEEKKNQADAKDAFQTMPHVVILTLIVGASLLVANFVVFSYMGRSK